MMRLTPAMILLILLSCGTDKPFGGEHSKVFVIATDTVQSHYPIRILFNGEEIGQVKEMTESLPKNCGEILARYDHLVEPPGKVVRVLLPVGTYQAQAILSGPRPKTLSTTYDATPYCNYLYIPSTE